MSEADVILTELRAVRAELKRLAEREAGSAPVAVKRSVAAKMLGVGLTKLDALVREGKLKTAEDSHLIPVVELRRYAAPKTPRKRKPAVGHRARMKHVDGTSDEAWAAVLKRAKAGG
jgi:hypothetical protein